LQGADLASHVDDAAAVDNVVGGIEDAALEQLHAGRGVGQLVVGAAGDHPGADARQGVEADRAAQGAGGEDVVVGVEDGAGGDDLGVGGGGHAAQGLGVDVGQHQLRAGRMQLLGQ